MADELSEQQSSYHSPAGDEAGALVAAVDVVACVVRAEAEVVRRRGAGALLPVVRLGGEIGYGSGCSSQRRSRSFPCRGCVGGRLKGVWCRVVLAVLSAGGDPGLRAALQCAIGSVDLGRGSGGNVLVERIAGARGDDLLTWWRWTVPGLGEQVGA